MYEGYKSVLNFCILNYENECPKDSNIFINKLMKRKFEPLNESYSNYGNIDIQFDYNFSNPLYIPVANCYGPLE